MMTIEERVADRHLATQIVARLNRLIENKRVRMAVTRILETRVSLDPKGDLEVIDHPTIQVSTNEGKPPFSVGPLGLLNGIVGADENQWGYITARYDDDGVVVEFLVRE